MFCGAILVLIGAAGYFYGMNIGAASLTALIPAAFGVVLMLLGLLGSMRDGLRKHMMHAAAAIALLGFLLPVIRLISKMREFTLSAATISQLAMAIVCLIFVLAAVSSFANARRTAE